MTDCAVDGIQNSGEVPTLAQVNALRLSRSQVVKLLGKCTSAHDLEHIIRGCYVRVLLEAADPDRSHHRQLYRVARVESTSQGTEYGGYSFQGESTTTYLNLDVRNPLSGDTGVRKGCIQLNSISNSDFSLAEFSEWRSRQAAVPAVQELAEKCRQLLPHLRSAGCVSERSRMDAFAGQRTALAVSQANAYAGTDGKKRRIAPPTREDVDRECQVLAGRVKELEDRLIRRMDFPSDVRHLTADELNKLEDSVTEYVGMVRRARRDLSMCKVCMVKDSEVVLLPCKHQVLCQSCARRVTQCPMCRTQITDRMVPHKG